ncbi:hypothetical protein PInf_011928 [Phytophthora infestans]|nr:hypothetical protein PInf_011928 [Phytophthora infestans]
MWTLGLISWRAYEKKMAPAAFTFLSFGKNNASSSDDNSTDQSRAEKYASLIGVDPDMLFYLIVAGIACVIGILFGAYALASSWCRISPRSIKKGSEKAIGVLMMILNPRALFVLISSATSFTESNPDDPREGVAFAIVGLQVVVPILPHEEDGADEKTVQTTKAQEGSEASFALGGEPQYDNNIINYQSRGGSMADDMTPKMRNPRQYA